MNIKESAQKIKSGYLVSRKIELLDLFSNSFMQENTTFKSFEEMLSVNNIDFNGQEEFDNIDITVMDTAVRSCSEYKSWTDLLQSAVDYLQ